MISIENKSGQNKEDIILLLIGTFLGIFSIAVLLGIFFTDDFRGRVVNGICGILFLAASVIAIFKHYHQKKKQDKRI